MCIICEGEKLEGKRAVNIDLCRSIKELPALPEGLEVLRCVMTNITSLPDLPKSLRRLICFDSKLNSLPPLPEGLEDLHCDNNNLTCLPVLPKSLINLSCCFNRIKVLPELPEKLQKLFCTNTEIKVLPALPASLYHLSCGACKKLGSLPTLPEQMSVLNISSTRITSLNYWPKNINGFYCDNTMITDVPEALLIPCWPQRCPFLEYNNPYYKERMKNLYVLQKWSRKRMWKRRLNRRHYLKKFIITDIISVIFLY